MSAVLDRWYSRCFALWYELTLDGPRVAPVQGPPPATFVDGLSREERREFLARGGS